MTSATRFSALAGAGAETRRTRLTTAVASCLSNVPLQNAAAQQQVQPSALPETGEEHLNGKPRVLVTADEPFGTQIAPYGLGLEVELGVELLALVLARL